MLSCAFIVPSLQAAAGSCCVVETSAVAGKAGAITIVAQIATDAMHRPTFISVLLS